MENHESFRMTYSAQRQEEIQAIRNKYTRPEEDKLERLRRLDAGVTKKASTVAISVGTAGALHLGVGMSLCMTELGDVLGVWAMPVGVVVGLCGIALVSLSYPLYLRTARKAREKVAPEILRLTDELMQ